MLHCGVMGHFAGDCRGKSKGKRRGGDGGKGFAKERHGKERFIQFEGSKKGYSEEKGWLAFPVATEGATRTVLSTVVPRKSTGEWICRRLMAWLREIGLEFVDIIVKSDNTPASLIESWSTLRVMKSRSRMIIENSPFVRSVT